MSCPHLETIACLVAPEPSQVVQREECTQCFDSQDLPLGIEVCLSCFNGACSEPVKHHAQTHISRLGHKFTLNVKRKPRPSSQRTGDEEPPTKITKLAIVDKDEDDMYETSVVVKCWACEPERGRELPDAVSNPNIKFLVDRTMRSFSAAHQAEIQSWRWVPPCVHTLTLKPTSTPIPAARLRQCGLCDLKENLWLCLICGSVGCGRRQYDGSGGNGHALQHWNSSMHTVCIKLGTITPEGNADIYCLACDDARSDPDVAVHLASFGINIQTLTKTDKTMVEVNMEHNLKYDFSLITKDGHALEPLVGPGLTGLAKIGDSSYIASTLQVLFSLPDFQARYHPSPERGSHDSVHDHALTCPKPLPASCIECQLRKIADGLLSGRYAVPRGRMYLPQVSLKDETCAENKGIQDGGRDREFQAGLKPWGFKALVGRDHPNYGTLFQQDAGRFLKWFIEYMRRNVRVEDGPGGTALDPTRLFTYALEHRLQCASCMVAQDWVDECDVLRVYVPSAKLLRDQDLKEEVHIMWCIEKVLQEKEFDDWVCAACGGHTGVESVFMGYTGFKSFPQVLVVHADKLLPRPWVPYKLDVPDLLEFGEAHVRRCTTLPDDSSLVSPSGRSWRFQWHSLGRGMERAVKRVFRHGGDVGNELNISSASYGSAPPLTQEELPETMDMPVRYRLKAFVSHKGPSPSLTHYVAHVRVPVGTGEYVREEWVLFNDEKVVKADEKSVEELKALAYLCFFERI